jgi:hypothetical protein
MLRVTGAIPLRRHLLCGVQWGKFTLSLAQNVEGISFLFTVILM